MSDVEPQAQLICRSGEFAGRTFQLGAETRMGRDPANDIVLDSPTVSKRHALITLRDGRFLLEDLDSTHGTAVDGIPVVGNPVPLERMHVIELSDVKFVYTLLPGRSEKASTTSSAASRDEQAVSPSESPGRAPPGAPEPRFTPAAPESGGTIVDSAGFGALPDLRDEPKETGGEGAETGDESPGAHAPDPNATQFLTSFAPIPERSAGFDLSVTLPEGGPTKLPLEPGDNVVGRGEDCDIKIEDPERWLSRKHAILRVSDEGVELIDLGGVNGTFIDGKRIDSAKLEPGATFVLGSDLEFTLQER